MDQKEGNYNTGHHNTGHHNTGDYNTGDYNTGYHNTGHHNTGDLNTGHHNTGYHNTGHHNTGDLNTSSPSVRLFNKESEWEFYGRLHLKLRKIVSSYTKYLCVWVFEKDMGATEKSENPTYETTGGYLKVNSSTYSGKEVSIKDRNFLEAVPNFCPRILEETTGIVFNNTKKIVLDNKEIEISNESYEALKKSLGLSEGE